MSFGINIVNAMDCVILAAGKSVRMGFWKMMALIQGKPLIRRTCDTALNVCDRIILVSGFRHTELENCFLDREEIQVVRNRDFEQGMFSSVQTGVAHVESDPFFLIPGDLPLVFSETYRKLLEEFRGRVVIPLYRGKTGHPVLLPLAVKDQICSGSRFATLRDILNRAPWDSFEVDDPWILRDADVPEHLERFRNGLFGREE